MAAKQVESTVTLSEMHRNGLRGQSNNSSSAEQLCSLLQQGQTGDNLTFAEFKALCAFIAALNGLFAVLAVLGNSVVFAVFYRFVTLRTPSNMLLTSLSLCDFLVGLITQPILAAEIVLVASNSLEACLLKDLYVIFLFAFSASSMLHVCIISLERFVAIFYPFKHQDIMNKKNVMVFSIVVFWISWTLLTVFTRREHGRGLIGYSRMGFVIFSVLLVIIINLRLWVEARKHSRRIQNALPLSTLSTSTRGDHQNTQNIAKAARNSKASKTIFLITGVLIVCNLPLIATFTARKFYNTRGRVVTVLWFASNTVVLFPAVLNPVIYCWRRRDLRSSIKRMFGQRYHAEAQQH